MMRGRRRGFQDRQKARSEGMDAIVLARTRVVHFEKVTLGRDYGTTVEVFDGLHDGESVVVDPGDAVKEGAIVQIAPSAIPPVANQQGAAGKK